MRKDRIIMHLQITVHVWQITSTISNNNFNVFVKTFSDSLNPFDVRSLTQSC